MIHYVFIYLLCIYIYNARKSGKDRCCMSIVKSGESKPHRLWGHRRFVERFPEGDTTRMIGDENRPPIRIDVRDSSNKVRVLAIHCHK